MGATISFPLLRRNQSRDQQQWQLLTGDRETIFALASYSYFVDIEEGSADGFFHSETFVLLDAQRRIRGVYNGTLEFEMKQLIQDIGTLLSAGRA